MAARRLTRRAFLATAAAGATAGPFVFTPARAQGFNWKRFQGEELFLMLTKHPFIDVLEKNIPEFESLSGMKVKWETLPEIQARQKMTVEMTANSGGIDAFFTSLHVEKRRFGRAGWYPPLTKSLAVPSWTSPDFDWNDFTPGARAGVTQPDSSISALAAFVDANVLFYRKDLFGAKGLTPPKTLAELEPIVKKLHAPPATYGIVLRGLKNANATQYPSIRFPMGGTYLKDGKAALDTKEQVAALGSTRACCGNTGLPAWSTSTGTSARRRSCRARSRCTWTASTSRASSRTPPSPRWSARSGTRCCHRGRADTSRRSTSQAWPSRLRAAARTPRTSSPSGPRTRGTWCASSWPASVWAGPRRGTTRT